MQGQDTPSGNPSPPRKKLREMSLDEKRAYNRECMARRRAKIKAAGLCSECGQRRPCRSGRSLCQVCLARIKAKREELMAQDMCQCGVRKRAPGRSACDVCRKSMRVSETKRYYRLRGQLLCTECENPAAANHRLCAACLDKERAAKLELKRETFNAYGGPRCVCCRIDIIEFLTIEHPDRDGGAHRKSLGDKGGVAFYRRLKKQGFPQTPRMEVLCFNCNFARNGYGSCPCQQQRLDAAVADGDWII